MINAQVINFWRGVNLETGVSTSKVTLRLPGGLEIESEVPEGYLSVLLEAAPPDEPPTQDVARAHPAAEQAPLQEKILDLGPTSQQALDAIQENVSWEMLPEEVLPDIVKYAFKDHGLPGRLPAAQVLQIRDAFLSEYTDDDWKRIISKYSEDPEQEAPLLEEVPVPARSVDDPQRTVAQPSRVDWGEGIVTRPSVPSRTVPKDAMGYPIVQRSAREVDPGELVSVDEDGVEDL